MINPHPDDPELATRLEQRFVWDQLTPEDRLDFMFSERDPTQWFTDLACSTFAHYREDPLTWGRITATALNLRLSPARLEAAVDAWRQLYSAPHNGAPHSSRVPPPDHPGAPPLPAAAVCLKSWGHSASWVERYATHSRRWSPRGVQQAHTAAALWVLSTIAARRVFCQVGPSQVFPVMFLAMIARSTLYAKSTTAGLGIDLLKRAGCDHLLTADRTTPQALMRGMSGVVPTAYGQWADDKQAAFHKRVAFAGQRGAYLEEWGGMLNQIRRTNSPMADFHTLLRVLDDGRSTYGNDTIQRGLEQIDNPYLAILASATPHDLAPFMTPGAAWWHDGFWPRFAFITPAPDEAPALTQRERTGYHVPGELIVPLMDWHQRLGVPQATVAPALDQKGKETGLFQATLDPLPQTELGISAEVFDAYEAYNIGLLTLIQSGDVPDDFDASYGRFHDKALRIALLLASLEGAAVLTIQHWAYAQHCTEQWRQSLHHLVTHVQDHTALTPEEQTEQKILAFLTRHGAMSARDIQRFCNLKNSMATKACLDSLVKIGHLDTHKEGRSVLYSVLPEEHSSSDFVPSDVPF